MAVPYLDELVPQNALAIYARAASHPAGFHLVTGQPRSGKVTTALAMARTLERRGASVTYLSEADCLPDAYQIEPPPGWAFLPGGRTAQSWRDALESLPPGPATVVVVDKLTPPNAQELFRAASRHR